MKITKVKRLLASVMSLMMLSIMLTGHVFACEQDHLSNAFIPGISGNVEAGVSAVGSDDDSASVVSAMIKDFSIRTSIDTAQITGIKDKVWTGKRIRQSVEVRVSGLRLNEGTDYKISYSNNKNVGKAKIKITGKGNFKGSVTKTFFIYPRTPKITGLKRNGSRMTVKWTKIPHQITGYEIAYNAGKYNGGNLRYADITRVSHRSAVSKTIHISKTAKRYRVWIRSYKKTGGKKYYSEWSDYAAIWDNGRIEW